jgi:hypothetical protein
MVVEEVLVTNEENGLQESQGGERRCLVFHSNYPKQGVMRRLV